MRTTRCLCLLTIMVLLTAICLTDVLPARTEGSTTLNVLPMNYDRTSRNGMVRVHLASMGNPSSLTITIAGSYTAQGNQSLSLRRGQQVKASINTSSGTITLVVDGKSYSMGSSVILQRHQTDGENGLRFAQARVPGNLYPGDLKLEAVKSGSSYKMYPILSVYIETYLEGVVAYEMGASAPLESLKAQAVAARTYTLSRMAARKNWRYDVVDTTNDQVYSGSAGQVKCNQAIAQTTGIVLTSNGSLIETYYTASNGGQTESAANLWGARSMDYLTVHDDPFDLKNSASPVRSVTIYKDAANVHQTSTIKKLIRSKLHKVLQQMSISADDADIVTIRSITPHTPKYAAPSRLYTKLDMVVDAMCNGKLQRITLTFSIFSELESQLGMSINGSKNELWTVQESNDRFVLQARRYGHGVGMSQRGAMKMGEMGYTYDQILSFYFTGSQQVQYTLTQTIHAPIGSSAVVTTTEGPVDLPEASLAQGIVDLQVSDHLLAVMDAPSAAAQVIMGLSSGTIVKVLSINEDWALIQWGSINGFVPVDLLDISGMPDAAHTHAASNIDLWARIAASGTLNLRSAASMDAEVLAAMPENEIIPVLMEMDGWYKVQYGTQVGYASSQFLRLYDEYPLDTVLGSTLQAQVYSAQTEPILYADNKQDLLLHIPDGEAVTLLGCSGAWRHVRYGVMEGWITADSLAVPVVAPLPDDPVKSPDSMEENDPQPVTAMVTTEKGWLNLRAKPQSNAAVLARIPQNEVVTLSGQAGTWSLISWKENTGYVLTRYLTLVKAAEPSSGAAIAIATIHISNGTLKLRETPSNQAKALLYLQKNDTVELLAFTGTWVKIRSKQTEGYVQAKYLRLRGEEGGAAVTPPDPEEQEEPAEAAQIMIATVATDHDLLNLRKSASSSARVLARIPKGTKLEISAFKGDWALTEYDGKPGYVQVRFLILEGTGRAWVASDVTGVNLRTAASLDGSIVRVLKPGTEVFVLSSVGSWYAITSGGETGYIAAQYIQWSSPKKE